MEAAQGADGNDTSQSSMRLRIQRQFFALEFFHPAPTETTVGRF
jgi:hypothetical protein